MMNDGDQGSMFVVSVVSVVGVGLDCRIDAVVVGVLVGVGAGSAHIPSSLVVLVRGVGVTSVHTHSSLMDFI